MVGGFIMKRFLIIMLALVFVLSACNNNPNDGLIIIGPGPAGNVDRNEVEKVVGDVSTAFADIADVKLDGSDNTVDGKTMTIEYTPLYEDSSVATSYSITVIDENAGKKIIGYSVSISIVSGEDTIAISYSTDASGEINSAVTVTLNSKAVSNADVSSLTSQVTTAIAEDIVTGLKTTLLESISTSNGFATDRVFNRISWLFNDEGKPSTDTKGTIEWADESKTATVNADQTEISLSIKVTGLLYSKYNSDDYEATGTVDLVFTGSMGTDTEATTFTSSSVAFKNLDVEITSVTDAFNPIELKAEELKIGFASGSGAEFAVSDSSVTDLNNPSAIKFDLSGFSGTNITLNGISTEIDSLS